MRGLQVVQCYATVLGGGLFCERSAELRKVRLLHNVAGQRGGGLFAGNEVKLEDCFVENNHAIEHGGGVWSRQALRMLRCVIAGNTALNDGGGIVCTALGETRNCVFDGNTCGGRGGGPFFVDESRLYNSVFCRNEAQEGGGLVAIDSRVRNVLCYNNVATAAGGGASCGPGGVFENCTVVANSAPRAGGVLAKNGMRIRNTISYYNARGNIVRKGRDVLVTYSCFPLQRNTLGNIPGPPHFVDESVHDYRLRENSPCIDAGVRLPWMACSVDIYGSPRVAGRGPDIGAYEFVCETSSNAAGVSAWLGILPDVAEPACLQVVLGGGGSLVARR